MKKPSRVSILLWLLFFSTAALAAVPASQVLNDSTVTGTTAKDAFNWLLNNQPALTGGLVRSAPCPSSSACGTNPPVYQLQQSDCGTIISTASFRNSGNTFSTNGNVVKLPALVSPQICDIWIVQSNLATQFVCIDPNGQKFSSWYTGYTDILKGDSNQSICFPPQSSSIIRITFDQLSWLVTGGTPEMMASLGLGQLMAQGQVYLTSVVNATNAQVDVALCPLNGNGLIADTNQLGVIPAGCAWERSGNGSSNSIYFVEANSTKGAPITAIGQGAANGLGGFYTRYTGASFVHLQSGDTACLWSMQTNLGTAVNGCWIVNVISSTQFDAVMQVQTGAGNPNTTVASGASSGTAIIAASNIGGFVIGQAILDMQSAIPPGTTISNLAGTGGTSGNITLSQNLTGNIPAGDVLFAGTVSSYTATDSLVIPCAWSTGLSASCGSATFLGLSVQTIGPRSSSPVSGAEIDGGGSNSNFNNSVIVGVVRLQTGRYVDTITKRYVSSWFNPRPKKFLCNYTTTRSTSSLTTAELNQEIRCNFVNFAGAGNTNNGSGSVPSRPVIWSVNGTGANNTVSDGCTFGVGFDGIVPEPETSGFINSTATATFPVNFSGINTSLSETNHYITVLGNAITGGTCSLPATLSLSGTVLQ